MTAEGYFPISQFYTQGKYSFGDFLAATIACFILIGFLVFLYMIIVEPDGTLTVTYELGEAQKVCPRCAEMVMPAALVCRFCGYEFPPVPLAATTSLDESTEPFEKRWSRRQAALAFGLALVAVVGALGWNYLVSLPEPSAVKVQAAAEQGNADAQARLGWMYDNGLGVPEDGVRAFAWYRKAAEQGNAIAQNNLGLMYEKGSGVLQDYAQAVVWYRRAAEQGNAMAQSNLGLMYEKGLGVLRDYVQAVAWYRKAAEQGNATAQNYLGNAYSGGLGVTLDVAEAVNWWRKAADQGDPDAPKHFDADAVATEGGLTVVPAR